MSTVIKTIKGRKYAYIAFREKDKVIHRYLGPAGSARVAEKLKELKKDLEIPRQFHVLFWDADTHTIDVRKNARYIVERVLEMGGLDAFFWIQRMYPTRFIIEALETSRKISPKSKNFWEMWLGVGDAS